MQQNKLLWKRKSAKLY